MAWPDNWQPHGTPCGPTSSRACKPHLMTPPASQACRYWGLMSTYGITRTDADEAPVSYRHRGPDARGGSSHGPLEWTWSQAGLAPCTRTG